MKYEIIRPDTDERLIGSPLSNLSLRVLSKAALKQEYFDNLFFPAPVFPDDENLRVVSERIQEAIETEEKIFVFGDYDADGISATSLMVAYLKRQGADVGYYIPNRLKEGYGLTKDKLEMAVEKGYSLVITVDNGVSAYEALDYAETMAVDVIIMDHHIIPGDREYEYILHPDLFENPYFRDMCGAGVVLQYLRYNHADRKKDWILAMVATVGDMVPVFLANREILKKGLQFFNEGAYPALSYLSKKKTTDETGIGFDIVPNINTVGRLADRANVNNLVKFLLLEDETQIIHVANQLKELNKERQQLVKDAKSATPDAQYDFANYKILISKSYHEGIIGLLANACMNEVHKPVIVFAENEKEFKGSGRSPKSYDIHENLSRYKDLFAHFGGHEQACGVTISKENFQQFIELLKNEEAKEIEEEKEEAIAISLEDLTLKSVEELFSFRPFGMDFKLPDFYLRFLPVNNTQILKNEYRKTVTYKNREVVEVLCFNPAFLTHLEADGWHDVIVTLNINEFNGKKNVPMYVKDVL